MAKRTAEELIAHHEAQAAKLRERHERQEAEARDPELAWLRRTAAKLEALGLTEAAAIVSDAYGKRIGGA